MEGVDGLVLTVVGLDESAGRDRLLGDGAQRAAAAGALARDVLDEAGEALRDPPEDWDDDERGEGQLPLQPQQGADEEDQLDDEPRRRK